MGDLESGSKGFKENSYYGDHTELEVRTDAVCSERCLALCGLQCFRYNVSFASHGNPNKYHCVHFVRGESDTRFGYKLE